MEKEIICISCPIGCHLQVLWENKNKLDPEDIRIQNNKCKRGIIYGREEILAPKRVVTATCAVESVYMERIPVKTTGAIIKNHIGGLLGELYKIRIKTPVRTGDIIIKDFMQTGVNVVATRSLSE